HSQLGSYTHDLIRRGNLNPTKGKKDAGDHPPITPLESLELNSSRFENLLQKRVYDLLTRHYLALFGEDATESSLNLKLLIKDESFKAQRVSIVSQGFLKIAPFLSPNYENEIQLLSDKIPIKDISINQKETKPKPKYTDTSLLKLMEKNHLGTKSTRPVIIQVLQTRTLIERNKNQYSITELGTFIIENLMKVWLPFLNPNFTKEIEKKIDDIKEKRSSMKKVVEEVRLEFLKLFDKFLASKHEIISKVNNYKINYSIPLTSAYCPSCISHRMKFINSKTKRFLVCSDNNCKRFLSLPKRGKLELLDSSCSICNFDIFKVSLKKNNKFRSYYLCPQCWNDSFSNDQGMGFCSNCKDFKIIKGQCIKK
ncbi:MAG: DNA topoisomerase, partial [Promethearchaeota archaeon]